MLREKSKVKEWVLYKVKHCSSKKKRQAQHTFIHTGLQEKNRPENNQNCHTEVRK